MADKTKLEKLRLKIDAIDATLVRLLAKRMRVVGRIGKLKQREGIAALDNVRWAQVLSRLKVISQKTGELDDEFVEDIWNRIHQEALKSEEVKK